MRDLNKLKMGISSNFTKFIKKCQKLHITIRNCLILLNYAKKKNNGPHNSRNDKLYIESVVIQKYVPFLIIRIRNEF